MQNFFWRWNVFGMFFVIRHEEISQAKAKENRIVRRGRPG
jgi:hypothetical protein